MSIKKTILISVFFILFCLRFGISQREYPPCAAYNESETDTISTLNSYSNTLYVGIDNILKVNKNILRFPFRVTTNNGIIYEDNSNYYIMPERLGTSIISIYPKANVNAPPVLQKTFFVKRLPQPQLSLCDLLLYKVKEVDRNFLLNCDKLDVFYTDDLKNSNNWLKIIRINMGYSYGSFFVEHSSVNNIITGQMKNLMRKIPPNEYLIITVTCINKDNVKMVLPSCNLKVY